MKIYDVYVEVTEQLSNNPNIATMKKEFIVAGNTPQEAAKRASWEARGYVAEFPLIQSWPAGVTKVTGVKIITATDLNYACQIPVKHVLNYTM